MSFFSFLESRTQTVESLLCIGLDPHIELLKAPTAVAAYDFCMRLVEATSIHAVAYKPNIAFFEMHGADGINALKRIVEAIPDEVPIILDAKRGDISSTARAYAYAAFHVIGANAITANPYLGEDGIAPFIQDPEQGVFILCKTSNPGASDLQDMVFVDPQDNTKMISVFEHIARLAVKWNQNGNIGLVVGSTHPEALSRVRAIAPDMWILAPGVGAQGADLESALNAGLREDRSGVLIAVSRSISGMANPAKEAEDLRISINNIRSSTYVQTATPVRDVSEKYKLADLLLEKGCIRFAEEGNPFILKSGLKSPIYIDLRRLVSYPELMREVAVAYLPHLKQLKFDRLAGLPYAAIPIATAISLIGNWPLIYPRKEVKQYGTKAEIEGEFSSGEAVVVIDDLTTTGGSKFEVIHKLTNAGLIVKDIVVLIDRQSGAAKALESAGYRLHTVFTLSELIDHWADTNYLSPGQVESVREFLNTQIN